MLKLRREEPAFRAQRPGGVDGAVLGPHAFVLRYFTADGDDRLLIVNLGEEVNLGAVAEPLLAPVMGEQWRLQWWSEEPRYGGTAAALDLGTACRLPAESAAVLRPQPVQTRP